MNKESFIQVLRNPKSISADQLAQVEAVVEQFPYFQIARSVIACGSKSLSKEDAQSQLAKAAIYTTNRQLLKRYVSGQFSFDVTDNIQVGIHRETLKKTVSTEDGSDSNGTKKRAKFRIIERRSHDDEKVVSSAKFVDLTKKQKEDDIDEELTIIDAHGVEKTTITNTSLQTAKEQADQEEEEIKEQPPIETSKKVIGEVAIEEEVVREKPIEAKVEEVTEKEEPKLKAGELVDDVLKNLEQYRQSRDHYLEVEQEILSKQESDAINDAIEKANTRIEKEDDKPAKAAKAKTGATKDKSNTTTAKALEKKAAPKKVSATKPKATKEATPKEAPPIEMAPEKVDNNIINKKEQESSSSTTDSTDKKEVQKEIIERFIKSNPKILPADEEPKGEITDLSTSSAEMKDDFATENLAVILVRQGKREKAIEIYEQLILKNPKKKSYFAARIAELK